MNQLSVDDKQRENRRNQSRERSSSQGRWGDDRRYRGHQQDRGFNDRRRFPTPGPSHRDRSFGRNVSFLSTGSALETLPVVPP